MNSQIVFSGESNLILSLMLSFESSSFLTKLIIVVACGICLLRLSICEKTSTYQRHESEIWRR